MSTRYGVGADARTIYHIRWSMQDRKTICGESIAAKERPVLVDGSILILYYYYGWSYIDMQKETPPVLPSIKWCVKCEEDVPWKVLASYGQSIPTG